MTTRTALTDVELDRRVARGKRVFMYAAFAMLLFFLLSLLNFVLAGGRMGLRDTARWDETAAWPLIPLPAFLVIAAGLAAVIGVFLAVPYFRHDTADDLVLMGVVSIILFGFMSLFFAGVYTSTSGIPTDFDSYPEQGVGWHWIAAAIQIPAVIALTVRGISLYRAHKRRKQDSHLESA
ncbi:hypothetical protein HD599_003084 [Conyzicola lurida]|uniref:Uncharacterized protein n=1 Tax=Conyzicola lurida TaxID=1172621 RepID=A0A841ASJ0_9MICO|nr:hypothetical protein [Conyzicola lurida]MBB5844761.1 hypothetical protein [Conyzicola lurida]